MDTPSSSNSARPSALRLFLVFGGIVLAAVGLAMAFSPPGWVYAVVAGVTLTLIGLAASGV